MFKQKGKTMQDWKQEMRERLQTREEKAFKRMDEAEANICKALGIESLTPMQVLIIRNEIEAWERADREITTVHDRLAEIA